MAARRCSDCGISYPNNFKFQKCPVHGTPTDYFQDMDVDEDWDWRATLIQVQLNRASKPAAIPPIVVVEVREDDDGQLWIASADLIRAGLSHQLQPDDVIEIPPIEPLPTKQHPCDCLWEIQGYRESTREYWVRPLRVPLGVPVGGD